MPPAFPPTAADTFRHDQPISTTNTFLTIAHEGIHAMDALLFPVPCGDGHESVLISWARVGGFERPDHRMVLGGAVGGETAGREIGSSAEAEIGSVHIRTRPVADSVVLPE
jgi:hypothetical protein